MVTKINNRENLKNRVIMLLAVAVLVTASFDILFAIDFMGFTVRISQFLAAGLYVFAFWDVLKTHKLKEVTAWKPLIICFLAILAATFHSQWYVRNIMYDIWMLSMVLIVVAFNQLFLEEDRIAFLMKAYLLVFDGMAIFGIVQFLLAFLGIKEFFLAQWLVYKSIPRVNGFMYEPSYFASYMVMGWAFCASLLREGKKELYGISVHFSFFLLSAVLIMSSSRMVYGVFFLWSTFYGIVWLRERFKERCVKIDAVKKLMVQMSVWGMALLYWAFVMIFGVAEPLPEDKPDLVAPPKTEIADVMFQGLGAQGNSTNINERTEAWRYTLQVFLESPILGRGLGAVTNEAKLAAGTAPNPLGSGNVLLEIFAAGGVVGGGAAIVYVCILLSPCWKYFKRREESLVIARALGYSLMGILLMLIWNATILRVYLWVHIAMITVWMGVHKKRWDETSR